MITNHSRAVARAVLGGGLGGVSVDSVESGYQEWRTGREEAGGEMGPAYLKFMSGW